MNETTDKDLIAHALAMWANHIETGNVALSAQDAANMGKGGKHLHSEQQALVNRLRSLSKQHRSL